MAAPAPAERYPATEALEKAFNQMPEPKGGAALTDATFTISSPELHDPATQEAAEQQLLAAEQIGHRISVEVTMKPYGNDAGDHYKMQTSDISISADAAGTGIWLPYLFLKGANAGENVHRRHNHATIASYTAALGDDVAFVISGPFSGCYAATFRKGDEIRFAHLVTGAADDLIQGDVNAQSLAITTAMGGDAREVDKVQLSLEEDADGTPIAPRSLAVWYRAAPGSPWSLRKLNIGHDSPVPVKLPKEVEESGDADAIIACQNENQTTARFCNIHSVNAAAPVPEA